MDTVSLLDKIDYYSVERLKAPYRPQEIKKKSILVTRRPTLQPRESSKTTIQWKGIQIGKDTNEDEMVQRVSSLPSLRQLMTKGSKWNVLQNIVEKIKIQDGKYLIEEETYSLADKGDVNLVRSLGTGAAKRQQDSIVKLNFDQEVKLEILKQKTKALNDYYLKQHPELATMLSLIYRKIFKHRPKDPKTFIADYVHHLNIHREKLVLEEVDVPFDRPLPKLEKSEEEEEREKMEQFVRGLLEECANSATLGPAYLNVTSILKSILRRVSPSSIITEASIRSAEEVVNDVITSLLTEVAVARTTSKELVIDSILKDVLAGVNSSIMDSPEDYHDVKQTVELFIKQILKYVTDKAVREVKYHRMLRKSVSKHHTFDSEDYDDELFRDSHAFKSILKTDYKTITAEPEQSRVRFKSVSE